MDIFVETKVGMPLFWLLIFLPYLGNNNWKDLQLGNGGYKGLQMVRVLLGVQVGVREKAVGKSNHNG